MKFSYNFGLLIESLNFNWCKPSSVKVKLKNGDHEYSVRRKGRTQNQRV